MVTRAVAPEIIIQVDTACTQSTDTLETEPNDRVADQCIDGSL